MANFEFKTTGFKELAEKLERAPLKVSKRVLRTGLLAAVEPWVRGMESKVARGWHYFRKNTGKAPEFGYLSRNIQARTRIKSDLSATAEVGPNKRGFWSIFLEFGTKKMAARPFMRQVFEERKQDVLDEFAIEVKAALEREGIKLS